MTPLLFAVTYEIVTPESAAEGEADERGFICEGVSLRDAIKRVQETRTAHVDGVECIAADEYPLRSVSITNGMEYLTGAQETRTLHMPA
jgi:hypothetical protein